MRVKSCTSSNFNSIPWKYGMGLVKEKSGVYYVRIKRGKTTIKFSLRTKSQKFADDLYYAFLKEFLTNTIIYKLPASDQKHPPLTTKNLAQQE